MSRGKWVILGLIVVLALGLLAAGCGTSEETTTTTAPATSETTAPPATTGTTAPPSTDTTVAQPTGPIKIGIAISLTGDSAAPCEQIKQGFETEAAFINSNGGINGRQVELVIVDDQSQMDTAVAAVQSLIDKKVDVIIGPFPQWTQTPTYALTEKAGILQVSFGPPTEDELVTFPYKTVFAPAAGADACADAYVKEMQAEGKKNVILVGDNMVISQDTLKRLEKDLPAAGVTATLMSDTYGLGDTDFTPIANKIAAKVKEVNPDAIILGSNPVAVNPLTKALRGLGVKVPIFNQASGSHPLPLFAPAGMDPANVAGDFAFGPAIVDPTKIPDAYPAKADLVAFVERWRAGPGKDQPFASLFLGFAYDTIHLAEQAILTAETQDAAGYAAALEKIDWYGAQGHYVMSAEDHVGNHGGFFQWQYTVDQGFKFIRDLNAM